MTILEGLRHTKKVYEKNVIEIDLEIAKLKGQKQSLLRTIDNFKYIIEDSQNLPDKPTTN